MKAVSKVLVNVVSAYNDTIEHGSLKLYVDTSFRPEHHKKQDGIAHADFESLGIKKGDTLWFHYLAIKDEMMLGKDGDFDIYAIEPNMVYAIERDGKLIMLSEYILVDIQKEKDEVTSTGIILYKEKENVEQRGIVWKGGDLEGEEIFFHESRAFINEIAGREVYVMEKEDILAVCN